AAVHLGATFLFRPPDSAERYVFWPPFIFTQVVTNFSRKPANTSAHIALGIQLGIEWKREIPETDQQSLRAKERARGGR
ncbi:MAG: hypothetical protein CMJ64_20170, partial [Planctomycetaceae bacterium]|nr:hypothetical protein [Planctomycetaceae bacterium]